MSPESKWFCVWPGLWRVLTRSGEYECERWIGYPGGEDGQVQQTMWWVRYPGSDRHEAEPDEAHDFLRDAKASVAWREAHLSRPTSGDPHPLFVSLTDPLNRNWRPEHV